jgi:hypothetical protein
MLPITHEPIGLIILITSWLTSNIFPLPLYDKWASLEIINTPTARHNISPPNSNYDGAYT